MTYNEIEEMMESAEADIAKVDKRYPDDQAFTIERLLLRSIAKSLAAANAIAERTL